MLNDTDVGGLDRFLASSGKDILPQVQEHGNSLDVGATLGRLRPLRGSGESGNWRVEAFLGRGGSGEVYRVVHSITQISAAAKVLTRDDEVAKKRFHDEIEFLAQNQLPQFPRYFESDERDGFSYVILELLEPIDVPTDEKGIAEYLTNVCACVRALHLSGIVHRDLKPRNIMRRSSGEVVLIDFGLAKDAFVSARPRTDVSIVSGKAVGVGTPEYAAPEQLTGGEISPAADIHALGRIANAAFGGNPPRSWETIIRRATSSIPAQRYETVDDFVTAIRKRNRFRNLVRMGLPALAIAILTGVFFGREGIALVQNVVQRSRSDALGGAVTTNAIGRQVLDQLERYLAKPVLPMVLPQLTPSGEQQKSSVDAQVSGVMCSLNPGGRQANEGNPIGSALGDPQRVWVTGGKPSKSGGDADWHVNNHGKSVGREVYVGSGAGDAGQAISCLCTEVRGPAQIGFAYRIGTYGGEAIVLCDQVELMHFRGIADAKFDWQEAAYKIPPGDHVLTFVYVHPGCGFTNHFNGFLIADFRVTPIE